MREQLKNVCSFFGHRNIEATKKLKQKVKYNIEKLIINNNVRIFLFGSRSEFDFLCHQVVTELKEKYTDIKRIAYTCKSETCILENEREKWEKVYSYFEKKETTLLGVEEEYHHKAKYVAGRASYVIRNKAMIDDSSYCLFYYDEDYKPNIRKKSKRSIGYYQPKSGTSIAYAYAKSKKKVIINVI